MKKVINFCFQLMNGTVHSRVGPMADRHHDVEPAESAGGAKQAAM